MEQNTTTELSGRTQQLMFIHERIAKARAISGAIADRLYGEEKPEKVPELLNDTTYHDGSFQYLDRQLSLISRDLDLLLGQLQRLENT